MLNFSHKFLRRVKDKLQIRWRLFYATDFQSLMCPCFTICRIFGMFPYKINASTFELYKPLFILWTFIICICCICELLYFIMMYEIIVSGTVDMKSVPRALERTFNSALGVLTAIITYILSGPRMRLLQTILNISSILPSESFRKLSWLIHTKDITGFSFIIVFAIVYFNKVELNPLLKLFIIYITLLVFQMDMMYMNCVCVLKACFKEINENLANLSAVNNKLHFFSLIYHKQRNLFLLMKLKVLKKWHLMVSDTVQMLNIIFNLQLLATITMAFIEVTFNVYFYILQWKENVFVVITEKHYYYSYFVIVLTFFIIKITLMIWACETNKIQALEIGTTVHDVFNCTKDKQIKYEVG